MGAAASVLQSDPPIVRKNLHQVERTCKEVAETDPGNTQKIASVLLQMSLHYYGDVRKQAQDSFLAALVAAGVGTLFFIVASIMVIYHPEGRGGMISLISGALIQVISGINFYLYRKVSRQFSTFHVCLERMNRFLVANSICANLTCPTKRDEVRAELVNIIGHAPMLALDEDDGPPAKGAAA